MSLRLWAVAADPAKPRTFWVVPGTDAGWTASPTQVATADAVVDFVPISPDALHEVIVESLHHAGDSPVAEAAARGRAAFHRAVVAVRDVELVNRDGSRVRGRLPRDRWSELPLVLLANVGNAIIAASEIAAPQAEDHALGESSPSPSRDST